MPTPIERRVEWVRVAGRWTRMSVMGAELASSPFAGDRRNDKGGHGENNNDGLIVVILMIPGIPGIDGLYETFGQRLLQLLIDRDSTHASSALQSGMKTCVRRRYFFVAVSQLNHLPMPHELRETGAHRNDERFTIDVQVQHKLDFCREHLPPAHEVYLLGHSIGAYMMLRILPSLLADGVNVVRACALFPVIERMASSPQGHRWSWILKFGNANDWLLKGLLCWLDWVPIAVRRRICAWYMRNWMAPACVIDAAAELVQGDVLRNLIYMACDELDSVVELDRSLLLPIDRLRFYYGTKDGWCPLQFASEMRQLVPGDQVRIDADGCEHAFVIKDGETMAARMMAWID